MAKKNLRMKSCLELCKKQRWKTSRIWRGRRQWR